MSLAVPLSPSVATWTRMGLSWNKMHLCKRRNFYMVQSKGKASLELPSWLAQCCSAVDQDVPGAIKFLGQAKKASSIC